MKIFVANRLSNGNLLFPTEIYLEDDAITIVKPGLISARDKTIKYNKLTSIETHTPVLGFSKIILTAYGLDTIIAEGFERRDADEIKNIVRQNTKGI